MRALPNLLCLAAAVLTTALLATGCAQTAKESPAARAVSSQPAESTVVVDVEKVETQPEPAKTAPAPAASDRAASSARAVAAPAVRPVETFDAVWTTVRDSHFDKSLNGIDWNAVREELRPNAIAAASQDELRSVLSEMLDRLGQSHFSILPASEAHASPTVATPEEQIEAGERELARDEQELSVTTDPQAQAPSSPPEPGVCGIDVALVEAKPTVLRMQPGCSADIKPGWVLLTVNGFSADDAIRPLRDALAREAERGEAPDSPHARQLRAELAMSAQALLNGRAGSTVRATFLDERGQEVEREIAFKPANFGSSKFGNLPAIPVSVESRVVEVPASVGSPVRIGVIDFNIWLTAASPAIDRAVDALRGCDGIVLDLRGNPGGVGAMSMGIAGHFLATRTSLGTMIGRDTTLQFNATPRKVSSEGKRVRPYSRPLALLVDERTASTSEVFAAGLQDVGRARVFGSNSAGMALPARAVELPNGDVLMHAVADFVTPNGQRIEGRGVVPDETTVETRTNLLAGRDAALDAATAWITGSAVALRTGAKPAASAQVETASVPTPAEDRGANQEQR